MTNYLKKTYDAILNWALQKNNLRWLYFISFIESIFFPISTLIIYMPFALANPKKSLQISFITMLFSVVGGIAAYFIGLLFWDSFGDRILALLHLQSKFDDFLVFAQKWQNLAVLIAGVTPLPFKVVTLSAGALKFNLPLFILFSFIARSIMFMVPGILIYIFGEKAKEIIDKNFKILTIIGAVALVVIVWWVSKGHA